MQNQQTFRSTMSDPVGADREDIASEAEARLPGGPRRRSARHRRGRRHPADPGTPAGVPELARRVPAADG